jgi:hypothetical protein
MVQNLRSSRRLMRKVAYTADTSRTRVNIPSLDPGIGSEFTIAACRAVDGRVLGRTVLHEAGNRGRASESPAFDVILGHFGSKVTMERELLTETIEPPCRRYGICLLAVSSAN